MLLLSGGRDMALILCPQAHLAKGSVSYAYPRTTLKSDVVLVPEVLPVRGLRRLPGLTPGAPHPSGSAMFFQISRRKVDSSHSLHDLSPEPVRL